MNSVEICEKNGWKAGTVLEGTEYYGERGSNTCRIKITALGEKTILAKCLTHNDRESTWTLAHRDWEEVK